MSQFFTQVKKNLFDMGSKQPEVSHPREEEEEEDNGEISPDSLDPDPEERVFSQQAKYLDKKVTTNDQQAGNPLARSKYGVKQKSNNTRIASPGAQLEHSNNSYKRSNEKNSRLDVGSLERSSKDKNGQVLVSPRSIPSYKVLGGAISDKSSQGQNKGRERLSSFHTNANFVAPNKTIQKRGMRSLTNYGAPPSQPKDISASYGCVNHTSDTKSTSKPELYYPKRHTQQIGSSQPTTTSVAQVPKEAKVGQHNIKFAMSEMR